MERPARYKLIALDLDGTLLQPDGTPSPRAKACIRAAVAAGYRVCIATGRNQTESRWIVEHLGIEHECVFVGGAVVVDIRSGKTLHRTVMHPELAREACELFESLGHAAMALQDTCQTGLDYLITGEIAVRPASHNWFEHMKMRIGYIPRLAQYEHEHTLRVSICCDTAEVAKVMPILQKTFADRTMMHSLHVPGMDCEVMEIFDPAVNKWEAISYIARLHGIEPDEIVAVGDDMNDLHMIKHSGLGVAMGNARPALKPFADRVIGSNTEDGLAIFLEQLLSGSLDDKAA